MRGRNGSFHIMPPVPLNLFPVFSLIYAPFWLFSLALTCLLFLLLCSVPTVLFPHCRLVCVGMVYCETTCKMKKQSLSSVCKCRMLLWMWKSLDSKKQNVSLRWFSLVLCCFCFCCCFLFLPADKQYRKVLCLGVGCSLSELLQRSYLS